MIEIHGLGAVPEQDATLETLRALERTATVFTDLDARQADWLSRMLGRPIRKGSADDVVKAGKRGLVGVGVWGHARWTSALARDVALRAECSFGVSNSPLSRALAKTATFLGLEGHQGACCHELDELLARPARARPGLPLVVYCRRAARWAALGSALLPLYPRGHAAEALTADGADARPVPLSGLGQLQGAAVLVVPPARAPAWRKSSGKTRPALGRGLTP